MTPTTPEACPTDISEKDVIEAMREIPGYLDITPADFRAVYLAAYRQAVKRLGMSVRAAGIMTRPVVSLKPEMPLAEAARILARHRISGAPVVDAAGRVAGVLSEKDFLALLGFGRGESFMQVVALCLGGQGCPAAGGRQRTVAEAMSAPAVTVGEAATLAEMAALMAAKGVNRLPVVDDRGGLVGIVTRAALVGAACALEA
jgi:CBS domain-containing protein